MTKKSRSRQPKGVPVGGEYASESGSSTGVSLAHLRPPSPSPLIAGATRVEDRAIRVFAAEVSTDTDHAFEQVLMDRMDEQVFLGPESGGGAAMSVDRVLDRWLKGHTPDDAGAMTLIPLALGRGGDRIQAEVVARARRSVTEHGWVARPVLAEALRVRQDQLRKKAKRSAQAGMALQATNALAAWASDQAPFSSRAKNEGSAKSTD